MSRLDTINGDDAWRIVCRIDGKTVAECRPATEDGGRKLVEQLAPKFDNVELQVRRTGTHRFRPVFQAIGERRLEW